MGTMVQNRAVDEAVFSMSLKLFGMLLMQPFPEHPIPSRAVQTMGGMLSCQQAKKEQRRGVGYFQEVPHH
ncbi:hypothetical protein TNCV_422531 [Trichonephila clavipes]|nr:hypothetical protein TNCV_422531 [Trichonephila clavipes]